MVNNRRVPFTVLALAGIPVGVLLIAQASPRGYQLAAAAGVMLVLIGIIVLCALVLVRVMGVRRG